MYLGKYLLLLSFALFYALSVLAQHDYVKPEANYTKNETQVDTIFTPVKDTLTDSVITVIVETMPVYPGGDKALFTFLQQNIRYPKEAKRKGIAGKVYVRYTLTAECKTDRVHVVKGAHPLLNAEAIRVVSLFKYSKPGTQNGKPVDVEFTFPIAFNLN